MFSRFTQIWCSGEYGVGLTPADVHLNRLLRGPDLFRAQSRVRDPSTRPSMSVPASAPCATLVLDQHTLKHPDCFGNSCKIHIVCEFTGAFWVITSKTGSAKHLQDAVTKFIHSNCNAFGHRVHTIHVDGHTIFRSMVAYFGSLSIKLLLAPPAHHAKRVERYTQTFDERRRMLDCSLQYLIPETMGLSIFADKHVAYSMRGLVNSQSHPSTPHELLMRERAPTYQSLPLRFQEVASIRMGENKRGALAHHWMVPVQRVPLQEVAVCLGRADHHTRGAYYFYVHSTRQVLIRRHFTRLPNVVPDFCVPNPRQAHILNNPDGQPVVIEADTTAAPGGVTNAPMQNAPPGLLPASHILPLDHINLADDVTEAQTPPVHGPTGVTPGIRTPAASSIPPSVVPASHARVESTPQPVTHPAPTATCNSPVATSLVQPDPPAGTMLDFSCESPVPPQEVASTSSAQNTPSANVSPQPHSEVIVQPVPVTKSKRPSVTVTPRAPSARRNKGQNPHLIFDNSAVNLASCPLQPYKFSEPTWHDILATPSESPAIPEHEFRVFKSARLAQLQPTMKAAGSRRVRRPHPRSAPQAPRLPLLLRHVCFLMALAHTESTLVHTPCLPPDWSAFSATSLLKAEVSPAEKVNDPSSLRFAPKANKEMTYRQAQQKLRPEEIKVAVLKELDKLFITHEAIRPISKSDIRPDAVRIHSSMLVKTKYFGDGTFDKVSARLAAGGNTQPEGSFGDTYAPTADEASTLCAFASFSAHAVANTYVDRLQCSNFDVKGAFLWVPRSNSTQIIMRLPSYIDHPLAGRDVEVIKSIYGLKDSNANFDADLRATILSAGFRSTVDPCIYIKSEPDPTNAKCPRRCIVSTHVDDGRAMYNHRPFYDQLINALEERYGPLSKDDNTTSYTGCTFAVAPDGSFTITQEGYTARLLDSINMKELSPRSTPSDSDLFTDASDTPLCPPQPYRQLVGSLIHLLRTRYDIQKEVVYLSSKMARPTVGDMAKGIKVLQYLKGNPTLGPRYYTTEGPVLYVYVDASYAVHTDGRSQTGCSFHIGRNSAPFFVKAGKQTECVSIGSMEAEYVALSQAARKLLEFRFLLEDIGFPQLQPTVIFEDNMSAINLAVAPHITRKSRHIHTRHHFIRDLINQKLAVIKHTPTEEIDIILFTFHIIKQHYSFTIISLLPHQYN